jgi:hypothetical protein
MIALQIAVSRDALNACIMLWQVHGGLRGKPPCSEQRASPRGADGLGRNLSDANSLVMNIGSLLIGRSYMLQSTTNLASGGWTTETNFMATQSTATFYQFRKQLRAKTHRVVRY